MDPKKECFVPLQEMSTGQVCYKGGGWEEHCKYIEQNCFSFFLDIQRTIRCILAAITSWQALKATKARILLLVNCMLWKKANQFFAMYLDNSESDLYAIFIAKHCFYIIFWYNWKSCCISLVLSYDLFQ